MKKGVNVKVIVIVVSILIIGSIVAYLLLNKGASVKSYGCDEIMKQVNTCWENRNPASTENFIECWNAPSGYINTCEEGSLESKDYMDRYIKCNELSIIYYPLHMLTGYSDKPEGMISFNCPLM